MRLAEEQNAVENVVVSRKSKASAARKAPDVGFWLLAAFAALYILTTHGHVNGMGYENEVYLTTKQIVEHGDVSLYGSGVNGQPRAYARNDLSQPLFLVPFYLAARTVQSIGGIGEEWVIALFNPMVSALTVYLVYRFAVALFACRRTAIVVSVLCGLSTMIWPYANIGMEPLQTLLVLATAYSVYRFKQRGKTRDVLAAAVALALLFEAKRASPVLVAVLLLYLAFVAYQRYRSARRVTISGVVAAIALLAISAAGSFWLSSMREAAASAGSVGTPPGILSQLKEMGGHGGWMLSGLYGFLFSAGKSYFVYNPPAFLGLLAFPAFFRRHRTEGLLFAGLLLIPYIFYSMLYWWADETWGPRYLHITVPFALLFLGAIGWNQLRTRMWRLALGASLILGIIVQILGLLFYYGVYHAVLTAAKLSTLQNIQFDPELSNIRINALIAWSMISTRFLGRTVFLDYTPRFWFEPPAGFEQMALPRHIDLHPFAQIGLWFPSILGNQFVPTDKRMLAAFVAVLLLIVLVLAILRLTRAFKSSLDEHSEEPLAL